MKKIFYLLAILISFSFIANAPAATSLSDEDLRFLKFFQKHEMIPADTDMSNIPPDQLKKLIELFKIESGIDDIDFAEKPDERFSSPEKTWELYRSAFLAGDIELSNRCLMPKFREKHDVIRKAIGDNKMKRRIEEMRPIERIYQRDGGAKYRIKRKIGDNDITFYIYFVDVFGKWRIDQY